jgi:hypothetical protein
MFDKELFANALQDAIKALEVRRNEFEPSSQAFTNFTNEIVAKQDTLTALFSTYQCKSNELR